MSIIHAGPGMCVHSCYSRTSLFGGEAGRTGPLFRLVHACSCDDRSGQDPYTFKSCARPSTGGISKH
eukprot:3076537-Pyramimonas_sp.AAC.1